MILLFTLIFISGCAYGTMATMSYHFSNSIFMNKNIQFWNPTVSWANKYSDPRELIRKKWLGVPVPVMFTDGYHLIQAIFLTLLFSAMAIIPTLHVEVVVNNWFEIIRFFILLRLTFGVGFVLFYNYILIK